MELLHPGGDVGIDLVGEVGEARGPIGERREQLGGADAEHLMQLQGRLGRVLHLVRGRDHIRGVLRCGQHLAVPVEHPAALARDRHLGHLLAVGLGPQRSAADALEPEGADEGETEDQQEDAEEKPEAAVDQAHPAPLEAYAPGGGGRTA